MWRFLRLGGSDKFTPTRTAFFVFGQNRNEDVENFVLFSKLATAREYIYIYIYIYMFFNKLHLGKSAHEC